MKEDIASGEWTEHPYQVSYSVVVQLPRNWFPVSDFVALIQQQTDA